MHSSNTPGQIGRCLLCVLFSSFLFGRVLAQQSIDKELAVIEVNSKLARPNAVPDRIMLTWESDPATSISVTWRTDTTAEEAIAQIAIATDGPGFTKNDITDATATTQTLQFGNDQVQYHTAQFTELKPSTMYVYRVGGKSGWSEWSHVTTASSEPEPFEFIYVGDAQNNIKAHWSRLIREAYKNAPDADFILHAGDLVNVANNDLEWEQWFYATGFIHRTVPAMATPGNHEYSTYGQDEQRRRGVSHLWQPTFAFPQNGIENLGETVYWIDYQGVRFVSLNSNERQTVQADWLKTVLKDNPNKWTIVFFHHPIYSNVVGRDNKELRNLWQPVFDEFGVDLVLQGHDHSYSRSRQILHESNLVDGAEPKEQNGTVYVVSVSGPKMYPVIPRKRFEKTGYGKQLFQVIRVDGNKISFEARTATGKLYDAFTLVKDEKGNNVLTSAADKKLEKDSVSIIEK